MTQYQQVEIWNKTNCDHASEEIYPLCSEYIVLITDRKLYSIFLNRKDFIKGKRKQKKEEKHVYSMQMTSDTL